MWIAGCKNRISKISIAWSPFHQIALFLSPLLFFSLFIHHCFLLHPYSFLVNSTGIPSQVSIDSSLRKPTMIPHHYSHQPLKKCLFSVPLIHLIFIICCMPSTCWLHSSLFLMVFDSLSFSHFHWLLTITWRETLGLRTSLSTMYFYKPYLQPQLQIISCH